MSTHGPVRSPVTRPATRRAPRRATGLAAASVLAGVGLALVSTPPASADPYGGGSAPGEGSYAAEVSVRVTGDVDPGLRATVAGPPPLCWWERLSWGDGSGDPQVVADALDAMVAETPTLLQSSTNLGFSLSFANRDPRGAVKDAVERDEANPDQDLTWYNLRYAEGPSSVADTEALIDAGCGLGANEIPPQLGGGRVPVSYAVFPQGQEPEPVVDPEQLAAYAYRVMRLVEPALDWNPRARSVGGATLVNLPTWLWTSDSDAVAEREVIASAARVSATVRAETDGVLVTSPAGTVRCDAREAATSYSPSTDEADACTLAFTRASWGYADGFPVEASTVWDARWTSSTGESGTLEQRTQGAVTDIPVAESQTVVTGAR
ncbi:hypothetical protein [Nocardioides bruguierae]|uniref:Uncharacterized protein n=1 Tax=Nocardioides bruguierae TaxID=2945102 RepID=A0A9X2IG78_9ACTN|nr:hypothetical protein [Nocardioides bruguierae]MCM0621279.1 hypothetical protein [Nocardioides bruguierae]